MVVKATSYLMDGFVKVPSEMALAIGCKEGDAVELALVGTTIIISKKESSLSVSFSLDEIIAATYSSKEMAP